MAKQDSDRIELFDRLQAPFRTIIKKPGGIEALLRTILEASTAIVFVKDLNGRYVLANPAFSRLFRRPLEEILGKKDEDLFPKQEADVLRARDVKVFETGNPVSNADRLTIDGVERVFIASKIPLQDETGKIIGLSGFATEITDEIRARNQLEHLTRTLRAIRAVNQLITRENDRDRLLQTTCKLLIETRGYRSAWIVLFKTDGGFSRFYHAGLGDVAEVLENQFKQGILPECVERALASGDVIAIEDPISVCGDCPLLEKAPDQRELTVRLEHAGIVYGVISMSIPREYAAVEEEQGFLRELAGDISFALHNIEIEEERQRAQEALRESEAHYRSIVENSHAGILVVDEAYRFVYVNDELCRLFDRNHEEIVGHDFREFLDEESRDLVADRYRRRQRGENVPPRYEFNVIRKDGTKRRVEISSTVIRDSMGQVRTVAQLLDITKRVEAEEKLKESESKYRSLIEDVLDTSAVGIFILDSDFKVVWINRALERYFGLRRQEIIGKDKRELIRTRIKDIFEDPAGFADKVLSAYDDNTYIENFECHVLPGPGREDRWLEHWSQPILSGRYAGGRVEHYTDITDRKKIEAGLEKSEERVRLLINTSPDAIFSAELSGRFLSVNRVMTERLGYSQEELLNMRMQDVIAPQNRRFFASRIKRILAGEYLREPGEYEIIGKDGQRFWIAVNSAPLYENGRIIGFLGIARDISDQVELQRKVSAIYELGHKLTLLRDIHQIVRAAVEAARDLLGMRDCSIYLVDAQGEKLILEGVTQEISPEFQVLPVDSARGIIPAVVQTGKAIYLPDVTQDPRYLPGKLKTRSELCVPLEVSGKVIGVINAESINANAFSADDQKLVEILAHTVAIALENAQLFADVESSKEAIKSSYKRLREVMHGIIEALTAAVELRDPYTAGHQARVMQLAVAIGGEMGLPADVIEGLRYAALVHDIGKLAIPAEILAKPTGLNDTEFAIIKSHPQQAYDILKGIEFPWPIADIVLQHHERLDGSGYPNGLKDGEILLEARILAVADVVEAMSSHRPYRPALGIHKALAEIEKNKGRLYDPAVVDACVTVFKNGFTFKLG